MMSKNNIENLIDTSKNHNYKILDGIYKFTPDISYSTGNFSLLREKHGKLQLDSINGTNDRLNTILHRTNWDKKFFKDKLILECGCGAGADTEILASLGANIISVDLAGLEIAKQNLSQYEKQTSFVQASLMDLPFKHKTFDVVYCHRVLQHTPDPEHVLNHILKFVKDDGFVFVHSYARNFKQMFNWKYALLPLTRKMNSQKLYLLIERNALPLFKISTLFKKMGKIGTYTAHTLIPFRNYRDAPKYKDKTDEFIIEVGIHDTFDALSPPYDSPVSKAKFKTAIEKRSLETQYEILNLHGNTVTILRSK